MVRYFPSFSEGLSLRRMDEGCQCEQSEDFPSFSEGLSLRPLVLARRSTLLQNFPSFSEGLSLRPARETGTEARRDRFPFLFGGAFIEAELNELRRGVCAEISLPFRRGFH